MSAVSISLLWNLMALFLPGSAGRSSLSEDSATAAPVSSSHTPFWCVWARSKYPLSSILSKLSLRALSVQNTKNRLTWRQIRALDCDQNLSVCEEKFDVVALVRVHGLRCSKASAEPQHIVGVRFHWSCEERRFQRERFSRAWFTPVSHRTCKSRGSAEVARMQSGSSVRPLCFHSPRQHEREGARSRRSAMEDLVFKLK